MTNIAVLRVEDCVLNERNSFEATVGATSVEFWVLKDNMQTLTPHTETL